MQYIKYNLSAASITFTLQNEILKLPSFALFSSDGGDGDWCGHCHSPYRHPHLLHLAEDPASKSVTAEIPVSPMR